MLPLEALDESVLGWIHQGPSPVLKEQDCLLHPAGKCVIEVCGKFCILAVVDDWYFEFSVFLLHLRAEDLFVHKKKMRHHNCW